MNRIDQMQKVVRTSHPRSIEKEDRGGPMSLGFPHRLFTPEHYEPRYDYPLVIWLHSDQSSEFEIENVMPALSVRNYVAVSIRGNHRCYGRRNLFTWNQTPSGQAVVEECIFEAIESASENLSIHPDKVFLAGYGSGGSLAQLIALRYPERFAGVVSCNGLFPDLPRSLVRWKAAKSMPILWMHGVNSLECGIDSMCDMLRSAYLSALQVYPVQFPCGDELDAGMLAKANRFMMQIVTGESIVLHEKQQA